MPVDDNYVAWVNTPQPKEELETIRYALRRGRPYGQDQWVTRTVNKLGLETTIRARGGYRRK